MLCGGRPRWQEEPNRPLFLISLPVCQTTSHRRCYNCRFWPLIPTRYAHLASIPSCLLPTITQDSVWHRIPLTSVDPRFQEQVKYYADWLAKQAKYDVLRDDSEVNDYIQEATRIVKVGEKE